MLTFYVSICCHDYVIHVSHQFVDLVDKVCYPSYTKVRWFIMIWFSRHDIPCGKKSQMASKMVDYKDTPYEEEEKYGVGNSFDLAMPLRSLKEEIRSCKTDNDKIIQKQENLVEVNAVILQSLLDLL